MAFTSQPHISAAANQGFPNVNTTPSSLTSSGFKEALMKGTAVKESLNVIYVEEPRFQTEIGSLRNNAFERRTSTEGGLFAILGRDFE